MYYLHLVDFYGFHVGKYTVRPMDAMGVNFPSLWPRKKPDVPSRLLEELGNKLASAEIEADMPI